MVVGVHDIANDKKHLLTVILAAEIKREIQDMKIHLEYSSYSIKKHEPEPLTQTLILPVDR
jgi:hypothetical protein